MAVRCKISHGVAQDGMPMLFDNTWQQETEMLAQAGFLDRES